MTMPDRIGGHPVIERGSWGARPPRHEVLRSGYFITEALIHYTTGEELSQPNSSAWVRNIQNFHMDEKGWWDIAYNFLVDRDGVIFVGRGLYPRGGHAGDSEVNGRSVGIAFLGDDDPGYNDATPAARHAIRSLVQWVELEVDHELALTGHRDYRPTTCPGDELYAWLRADMPVPGIGRYTMLFYGKRGTPDAHIGAALADSLNTGAYTASKAEVERALQQGTKVVLLGGPAAREQGFNDDEGVRTSDNVTVIVGQTAGGTGKLAFGHFA